MAGGIGNLTVGLGLDAAEFTRGLTKAQAQAEQAARQIKATAAKIGAAFGAAISINAFKNLVNGAIDAADKLNDLSKQTGVAVGTLGGLGFAASQAGSDLETTVNGLGKLNKTIAEAAAGNKEAVEFFEVLGLNVRDSSGAIKDAGTVYLEVADKFSGMKDGANKVALAIRGLGKAGAEQIKVFDEGRQTLEANIAFYKRYGGVTEDTAKKADEFKDTMGKINLISQSFGRTLAAELLGPLQALADLWLKNKESGDQFRGAATSIVETLKAAAIFGAYAVETFLILGKTIGAVAAALVAVGHADFSEARSAIKALLADGEAARKRLSDLGDALNGPVGRKEAGGGRGFVNPALVVPDRPDAPSLRATGGTGSRPRDEFTPLLKQVTEMQSLARAALDSEEKLNDAQKLGAKIAGDYAAGLLKITPAQLATLQASLQVTSALEKENEAREANLRWIEEASHANADHIESMMKVRDSLVEDAKAAELALLVFGLSEQAVDALAVARLRDAAASREQLAAQAEAAMLADVAEQYRQQAAAIRETADAKEKLAKLKVVTDEAKELNNVLKGGFTDAFAGFLDGTKSASDAFKSFTQSVLAGIAQIAAKKLAAAIFGEGGGVFGGAGSTGGWLGELIKLFGSKSYSGEFATGGYIPPGQWGITGERGKEVTFGGRTGVSVIPMDGGGKTVVNNISVQMPQGATRDTGSQFGAAIASRLAHADRRNN